MERSYLRLISAIWDNDLVCFSERDILRITIQFNTGTSIVNYLVHVEYRNGIEVHATFK